MSDLHKQVTELRKAGDLQQAWDIACPAVQENPADQYLKGAFFWLCYAYLKEVQAGIKQRASLNNGNFRPSQQEQERITFFLNWVVWLNVPAGGFEYRSLLLTFQQNLECFPELIVLLSQQGVSLFQPEDAEPYVNDKGESPSLMLKYARKCAKAWQEHDNLRQQLDINALITLLSSVRKRMKDNAHAIWLDYDQARCLIMAGRMAEARQFVIPVLRKKQTEPWAWGALAATYRSEPETAISLFAQGLLHVHDEKFAIKLWAGLAPLLAAAGNADEASMCLKLAMGVYQSQGWKLKPSLEQLSGAHWYKPDVQVELLTDFLQSTAQGAAQYLLADAKSVSGVVENIHQSGKGFHVYLDRHVSLSVRLGLFKPKTMPELGSFVALKVSEDGDVLEAAPGEWRALKDMNQHSGELRVAEGGFGFVDDTFVPPFLIKPEMHGRAVNLTRVMAKNKKKGSFGWKAIQLNCVLTG